MKKNDTENKKHIVRNIRFLWRDKKMKTKDIIAEEIETHVLSLLTCEKSLNLGGFGIQHLTVERMHDLFDAELLYTIHTLIPAENMKEESHTFKVKYPRGWKEAFKEEHFPAWLKRRYPVRYIERMEKVRFTAFNLYPRFPRFTRISVKIPFNI